MHWSFILLFLYIVLSQHAFLTVFSDSSQLPVARVGDLGIFRLFSAASAFMDIEMLRSVQADLGSLVPGAVVLYKTNESENGLKLATVVSSATGSGLRDAERRKFHSVLHFGVTQEELQKRRVPEKAVYREVGIVLRRWSEECECGHNYPDLPREFVKPVAEVHGVLFASIPCLGLPILLLHRLKIFLAGSGVAGGIVTLAWSLVSGQHTTMYDLDLDTRGTPRRPLFVWGCLLLCTGIAYIVYLLTVLLVGTTSTTVFGVFFFLYAGLHDVAFDGATAVREYIEDEIHSHVGGPAYFGWPVGGGTDRLHDDDLSYAHAHGEGLSTVILLRGRMLRSLASIAGLVGSSGGTEKAAARQGGGKGGDDDAVMGDVLQAMQCGLCGRVMLDPVVAADGFSYERSEIESYLRKHSTSPRTGRKLAFRALVRNNQLRNVIDAWRRDEPATGKWKGLAREELRCPITMSVMTDAVVTCDGHSYERSSIIQWLRRHSSSPKSNLSLGSKALVTNRALTELGRALCPAKEAGGPDAADGSQ